MRKRILAGLLSMCMLVTMMQTSLVYAEETQDTNDAAVVDDTDTEQITDLASLQTKDAATAIMELEKVKPEGFDVNTTENPYGVMPGRPFMMSTQNELMLYQTGKSGKKDWTTYYKKFNTGAITNNKSAGQMDMAINNAGEKGSFDKTESYATNVYSYVQSVSFDPTCSGRKDHVANVGFDKTTGKVLLWVLDTKTGAQTDVHEIGTALWLKNANIAHYQAKNFFAITAGDYLGNGLGDTIVVYVPGDNFDFALKEIRVTYDANKNAKWTENTSSRKFLHPNYQNNTLAKSTNATEKLSVSLDTGDFNGDTIDDLAVLSYVNRATGEHATREHELYTPVLATALGNKKTDILTNEYNTKYVSTAIKDQPQQVLSMYAPSVSVGDVNGDKLDEIVVAGYKNIVEFDTANKTTNPFKNSGDKLELAAYSAGSGITQRFFTETPANGFTSGGLWPSGDSIWQPLTVACAAINGGAAAEKVFIGGTMYDMTTVPAELFTPDYFTKADKGAGGAIINVSFIQSVAVGDFDGNDAGREQVSFSIGLKTQSADWYTYKLGIVGGCDYDDKFKNGKATSYGMAKDYYSNDIEHNPYVIFSQYAEKNNCNVVAIDNDEDGLLVKYDKKYYAYSDPTVLTVLQAAPSFNDLGGYGSFAGSTTYGVTNSYSYKTSSDINSSVCMSIASSYAMPGIKVAVDIGYTAGFSQSFDTSLSESSTANFSAGPSDTVVIHRTPVFLYSYKVWDMKTHEWADDILQVSVPKAPTYFTMSIKEYNDFVATYNKSADENNKKEGQKIEHLKPVNDKYLGNEGNPAGYRKDWTGEKESKQLSKGPNALGHNGGKIDNNWKTETGEGSGLKMTNKLKFGRTIQLGGIAAIAELWAGFSSSLDYGYNFGTYESKAESKSCSGGVTNIDPTVLANKGIPKSVSDNYNFNWTFGSWKEEFGGGNGKVPVLCFGFAVKDLSAPTPAAKDLKGTLKTPDSAELTWTANTIPGRVATQGYNVYLVEGANYTKVNETQLAATATSYSVTGLKGGATYSYVVASVGENGESVWSNKISFTTEKVNYSVNFAQTMVGIEKFAAKYNGNINIKSGDKVPQDSIINVDVDPDAGYTIKEYVLQTPGKPDVVVPATSNLKFSFTLSGDTTIVVKTMIFESNVTFGVNKDADGNPLGTINAYVEDVPLAPPGGTISGTVDFSAQTTTEGYRLKEWQVVSPSGTKTYAAGNVETFTLNPSEATYEVTAIFSEEEQVMHKITVSDTSHGTVTLTDAQGNALSPDESGLISVEDGSMVTFTATAAEYYKFKGWSGELTGEKANPTNRVVTADMTIGANFYAPVKYGVVFGPNITATADGVAINTAQTVAPGTHVLFTAVLNDERVKSWSVNGVAVEGEAHDTFEVQVFNTTKVDVRLEPVDNTPPTGEIKIGDRSFTTFTENVPFDIYLDKLTPIIIAGQDPESGVKTVEYQMTDGTGTFNPDGNWSTYEAINLDPRAEGKVIMYARITNGQGLTTIINSTGIVLSGGGSGDVTSNPSKPEPGNSSPNVGGGGGTNTGAGTNTGTGTNTGNKNVTGTPSTADNFPLVPICLLGMVSLSIVGILIKKRNSK